MVQRSPDNVVNRAIRETAESSQETAESSKRLEELMEKLTASTEELSQSSKRLEQFTFFLIGFTVFLAMIAVIELLKDFIPKFAVAILGFGFLAFILYIMYIITKVGNKKLLNKLKDLP